MRGIAHEACRCLGRGPVRVNGRGGGGNARVRERWGGGGYASARGEGHGGKVTSNHRD